MTTTNTSAQDVRSIMCFTDNMVEGYLITSATIPSTNEIMVDWLTPTLLPRIDLGGGCRRRPAGRRGGRGGEKVFWPRQNSGSRNFWIYIK